RRDTARSTMAVVRTLPAPCATRLCRRLHLVGAECLKRQTACQRALHELRREKRSSRIVMSAFCQKRTIRPLSAHIDVLKRLHRRSALPPESGHNVQLCSTLSLAKAESAPPFGMWRCVWIEKL